MNESDGYSTDDEKMIQTNTYLLNDTIALHHQDRDASPDSQDDINKISLLGLQEKADSSSELRIDINATHDSENDGDDSSSEF